MSEEINKNIEVGQITSSHGLKGEVKINPYTEAPERFNDFEYIIIDDKEYPIEKIRIYKGKIFIYLEGIDDVDKAEKLKNKRVFIPREFSEEDLEEDEYLLIDLIGLPVYDQETNEKIGMLKDILQTSGPIDNFVVQTEEKLVYIPALKEYFDVDLKEKKILGQIPKEFFEL